MYIQILDQSDQVDSIFNLDLRQESVKQSNPWSGLILEYKYGQACHSSFDTKNGVRLLAKKYI